MVGLWGLSRVLGEFSASFWSSYRKSRAQQRLRNPMHGDIELKEVDRDAVDGLIHCLPLTEHVSKTGLKGVERALNKKDYFGALLAIDSNVMPTRKDVCIALLKISCNVICNGYCVDDVAAATFNLLK